MEKRKEINDKLVQWILNKVKTEYADDVSLVLVYGSYVNGTANSKSDVDCYYIPKTEHGYSMAVDFIIEGAGYDIFPMSWERVRGIADLRETLIPLVGDAHIIYCSSASDEEQFREVQERLKRNLLNDSFVREIAAGRCETAGRLCAMLNCAHGASEVRKIAGSMIMTLADAVAIYNHDYYHYGLKRQFEDLRDTIPNVPHSIVKGYQSVVEAADIDDVIKYAKQLFEEVCRYLDVTVALQEVSQDSSLSVAKIDAAYLAALYEEISSTFNKIYVCCESGNYILAFLSAVCLQRELDDAREAGCPVYELLGAFHYKELHKLSEKTQWVENDLVQLITKHGGCIRRYESFEQFEAAGL